MWLILALNVVFVVCSTPSHVMTLVNLDPSSQIQNPVLWNVALVILAINSLLLPYLYPIINVTFRKAYVMALKCVPETEMGDVIEDAGDDVTDDNKQEMTTN